MLSEVGQEPAGSMIALISVVVIACEEALLFGQAKRASRERAREGPIEERLARTFSRDSFHSPKRLGGTRAGTKVMRPGGSVPIPTSYPFTYLF